MWFAATVQYCGIMNCCHTSNRLDVELGHCISWSDWSDGRELLGIAYRGVIGAMVRDVGYCVSWSDWSDGTG